MYKMKENKLFAGDVKYFASNHHDVHDILLHLDQSINSENVRIT